MLRYIGKLLGLKFESGELIFSGAVSSLGLEMVPSQDLVLLKAYVYMRATQAFFLFLKKKLNEIGR